MPERIDDAEARKAHERNCGDVGRRQLDAEEVGKPKRQFEERVDEAPAVPALGEQVLARVRIGEAAKIEKLEA